MNSGTAKKLRLAAIAAGLLLCGLGAYAAAPVKERLAVYEAAISSGDPVAAAAFLADGEAKTLSAADEQKGAALTAKATALKDLKDMLAMPWDAAKSNKLNEVLSIRIDVDKPLCKVGVGPEPEKLLAWITKYQPDYPADKTAVVKKSIRQWDVVFGTVTVVKAIDWDQAEVLHKQGVTISKASWAGMVIRERNAVIAKMMESDQNLIIYSDQALSSAKDQVALMKSINNVKNSGVLTPAQLSQLSGKSFNDQAYLLGSFFDNSKTSGGADMAKVTAARNSLPKEVLPSQQRALLGSMLSPAVSKEMAGTKAGQQVLAFYSKDGPLKIEVKPCDGKYSSYDPATRTIALDSETIQQYMRLKGYTADSLMKNKDQVAEIAKYMSPAVVYESVHQMQDTWGKKQGVYKPHVQEDEIEAMSLEGLYTSEKLLKDKAFKATMAGGTSYADKRVEVATEYRGSGSKKFATTVRQRYFSGLPSLDSAASQVMGAVSDELSRRAALPAQQRASLDATSMPLSDAMDMTPEDLSGSVGEIRTDALAKIEKDLSALGVYKGRYSASDRQDRKDLKTLKTASTAAATVPAL